MRATIDINKFGDVLITKSTDPTHFITNVPNDNPIIYKGFDHAPPNSSLLLDSFKHGKLFANDLTKKKFPYIKDDYLLGASTCVIIKQKDKRFAVLVKNKSNGRITNPVGMHEQDEDIESCAVREIFEETGITVEKEQLKKLGKWTFNTNFGGLDFNGQTFGFYCVIESPFHDLKDKVNYIDIDNNEISKLIIVDIDDETLAGIEGFSGLHTRLLRETINRVNQLHYLTSFEFYR